MRRLLLLLVMLFVLTGCATRHYVVIRDVERERIKELHTRVKDIETNIRALYEYMSQADDFLRRLEDKMLNKKRKLDKQRSEKAMIND